MVRSSIQQISDTQEWDLRDLYAGFDDPQFEEDLRNLQQRASAFREQYRGNVAQLSPVQVADCLRELESIHQKSGYLYAFPALKFAADTRDSEAHQFEDKVMEALTQVDNQLLFFDLELQAIAETSFNELQQSSELKNYRHYLDRIAEVRPHTLTEEVEQTRNRDLLTGREAFVKLRSVHLGEQEYDPVTTPDGKTADTEAELSALLFHPDADTRLNAYQSVRRVLKQHNSLYGYILNAVTQDHRIESQMRSYKSTLHKQLVADEVSEPVFRAIMDGMQSRFDLFHRYYRLKGKALGQKIRICDIYAPWTTETEPPIDYQTGVTTLLEALEQFDVNYARRAEEFFLNNWVDAKVRPGKRGGAFCAYFHGKHSYLLMSYTEDYTSLFTLAHEMGHGLHFDWIDRQQSYFNSNPPLVLAEVASTFNELLLLDHLLNQAGDDAKLRRALITRQLEDQLSLLFRQSTISRLELMLHDRAEESSFDRQFVNDTWMDLYRKLCGDSVELLDEHQYDWARIGHVFFKPFYCYQYTASTLVSLACYQKYREVGKDFVPGYLELLASGSQWNQVEALRHFVDVDLEDTATIQNALEYVRGLLNQLEQTL
ncbi:M3 family oligoendopeptidase [Baaleninema simplex]|uniref:M3 family oligoendopeptidase n=1 Tax=Baaleninema simplex TaxID=2862350 RepID=UPI000344CE64|nr:M3 family metallopeptidase [Baaleninema simplex]